MLRIDMLRKVGMGVVVLSAASGCLRRKETINVLPDGKVSIEVEYDGEPGDFETADALPGEESGWRVNRHTKVEGDGKESVTLSGERTFAAGEELPGRFSVKGDPDADLYLAFPTTVQSETRPDGVYFHFRRVYSARPWAYVQFWQDRFFDDSIKKIGEKSPEEMTHDERVQLVQAFAGFELFKQVELARVALKESIPDLGQDAWLLARSKLIAVGEKMDWNEFVDRVVMLDAEPRDKTFEDESKRLVSQSLDGFRKTLREAGHLSDDQMERFEAALARAQKGFTITKESGGHQFEILVHMPGEIVAHNADKIDDDGAAVWEFDGNAFRDRPFELMMTSKLPKGRDER